MAIGRINATLTGVQPGGLAKIVPTSVAVGSGSGSVDSNGNVSFSGSTSISLNDVFSSNYDRYRILIYTTPTANIGISLRYRVSGADDSSSNYRFGVHYTNGINGTTYLYSQNGATNHNLCQGFTEPISVSIDVSNPFSSTLKTLHNGTYFMNKSDSAWFETGYNGGAFNATTSFTGFTLLGGTQTGTIKVYGYN